MRDYLEGGSSSLQWIAGGSGQGQAEDLKEVAEVRDRVVGSAIPVSLLALIGIEHHSRHAGFPRSVDVAVHVIADVQHVLGRHGHTVERELEEPRVGFAVSMVTGNDDRVEVAEQANLVQLAAGICALRVGDYRERVAVAQDVEYLTDVRVQAEPPTRDAPGHLGQEQRDLL